MVRKLAAVALIVSGSAYPEASDAADGRLPALHAFFRRYHSPLGEQAGEFLRVSDRFGLDWRLLPSLAIVESGGRNLRNNNVFGWGNGSIRFPSVRSSLTMIAERLANDWPYRGKSLADKMKAYNPANRDYGRCVKNVMEQIH